MENGKGNGAHTIKLTVIRTRTAISSSRSQQISIIRKDGARTIIVLAIRIANVFIKELVNLRTVLLLMVKTVETNIISLLTVPLLAGMQSFAVNVKEKIITMRKLRRVVFPTPGIGFSIATCHLPLFQEANGFQLLVDPGSS